MGVETTAGMDVEVEGVRLHVEERGTGEPLVLVHGLGGTGSLLWHEQLPWLAAARRVLTYDLRGSGSSEVPPGPYSIDRHVLDLAGLIERLGLGRVALAGHSMGGSIVLALAARRPASVAAVVAVGAPTALPQAARDGLRTRADTVERDGMAAVAETVAVNGTAPSFRLTRPEAFRELVGMLESNDPRGYAAQCRGLAELDLTGELARVGAPVVLVGGDLDAVSPPGMNEANAALIPGAAYRQVADCGHILPWERPAELLDAMQTFLAEHAS